MPADLVTYFNRIDIGIFLFILEACLKHEGYSFQRKLFFETDENAERNLTAEYAYNR